MPSSWCPLSQSQPLRVWGGGHAPRPPPWQASEEEGLLWLSFCQIWLPTTTTRWLSVRISIWQEGERSKPRRPIGEEHERAKREWVRYRGNRVRDSSGGASGNFTEVITAHCRGGVIAFFRAACSSRLQSGLWMNLLIETPDSLMDCWRAQWGKSCATLARNGHWARSWCGGESYQLWRCIVNCEFTDFTDHPESFL